VAAEGTWHPWPYLDVEELPVCFLAKLADGGVPTAHVSYCSTTMIYPNDIGCQGCASQNRHDVDFQLVGDIFAGQPITKNQLIRWMVKAGEHWCQGFAG
jgi:hypothetical protein